MTLIEAPKSGEITIREYFSRDGSAFSNKDAQLIGPELQKLAGEDGLTADRVLTVARVKDSPLHSYFEWDNETAGEKYRLWQARDMMGSIRVRYIDAGEEKETRAFQLVTRRSHEPEARKYRNFDVLRDDSAFAAQKMEEAINDLRSWKRKYEPYVGMWTEFGDCFQAVLNQIGELIEDCRGVDVPSATEDGLRHLIKWRDQFQATAKEWAAYREHIVFMMDAIADAEASFGKTNKTRERNCLRCAAPFKSFHVGQRLCGKCQNANASAVETESVIGDAA